MGLAVDLRRDRLCVSTGYHRAQHRVRFLWCAHVVHHSSEHMNLGTALRQSPTGPFTKALFYWPLPLLGFDPLVVASAGAIATLYGFWTHTEVVKKLWAPLEWLFVTPSHHRAHHGSNPEYVDKNYGNFLIIWDRLFGTFEPEMARVQYGLLTNINTYNPLRIAFSAWLKLFRDSLISPLYNRSLCDAVVTATQRAGSGAAEASLILSR